MQSGKRERLASYVSGKEAQCAGFSGTEPSGYFKPGRDLLAYHRGETEVGGTDGEPSIRKLVILTDGAEWFVGAQDARVPTIKILEELYERISNGQRERHQVRGDQLGDLLKDPSKFPDVPLRVKGAPVKINTSSHSFE